MDDQGADSTALTAPELAAVLRVTPRRVRQLAEDGRLRRRGRGRFDAGHAINGAIGAAWLGQDRRRGMSGDLVAAVGWLSGFSATGAKLSGADLQAWRDSAERWGLGTDEAMGLLLQAAATMGPDAPDMRAAR